VAHAGTAGSTALCNRSSIEDDWPRHGEGAGGLDGCVWVQSDLEHFDWAIKREIDGDVAHGARLVPEEDVLVYLARRGVLVRDRGVPVSISDVEIDAALSEEV